MNEYLLVDMLGEISPELLSEDTIENDLNEKAQTNNKTKKIVFGITAGSLLTAASVIIAIKLRKSNFKLLSLGKSK